MLSGEGAAGKRCSCCNSASPILARDWLGMLPKPGPFLYVALTTMKQIIAASPTS